MSQTPGEMGHGGAEAQMRERQRDTRMLSVPRANPARLDGPLTTKEKNGLRTG